MKLYSIDRRLLPYILLLLSIVLAVFALWSWGIDRVKQRQVDKTVGKVQVTEHPDGKTIVVTHTSSQAWVEFPKKPNRSPELPKQSSPGYLGAASCAECHRERYDQFIETAHHKTSSEPTTESILGSFNSQRNTLTTKNSDLHFEMSKENDGFYQHVYFRSFHRKFRIDIVTGSGKNGQTYLHWIGNQLYQMHVTYFRETDQWINSPGYPDGIARYARPILPGCIECHATYFEWDENSKNRYRKTHNILGISCERCHGPGRDHIDYHQQHRETDEPKHIANPGDLSPDRANDLCSQCHSGINKRLRDPFLFRPGDKLEDFFEVPDDSHNIQGGIHTDNQLGRLRMSLCFTNSDLMTCTNCHNPHQQERGNLFLFSQRCLQCHQQDQCGMTDQIGTRIRNNCIDCHMPKRRDKQMPLATQKGMHFPLLRDHHIQIDLDATERVLKQLKTSFDASR